MTNKIRIRKFGTNYLGEMGVGRKVQAEDYNLLIVDDQAGVRRLLFEAFSDEGYNVDMAANGSEAVQKVSANVPSLILLDIKMPGMNGLETLQELRKICPDVLVVMMTAYGELEVMAETKKLGVQHYINKPFDLNEVRYLVKALLSEVTPGKFLKEIG